MEHLRRIKLIVGLAAEKINGVIVLAEVEIEIAVVLQTFQIARKHAGLRTVSLS